MKIPGRKKVKTNIKDLLNEFKYEKQNNITECKCYSERQDQKVIDRNYMTGMDFPKSTSKMTNDLKITKNYTNYTKYESMSPKTPLSPMSPFKYKEKIEKNRRFSFSKLNDNRRSKRSADLSARRGLNGAGIEDTNISDKILSSNMRCANGPKNLKPACSQTKITNFFK